MNKYKHFVASLFCEMSLQPDILGKTDSFSELHADAETIVDFLYEPLRRACPESIKRKMIGLDTSGEHEMWMYDFSPVVRTNQKPITVYLQSGVHPIEVDSLFALARIVTLLRSGGVPELSEMRFIVVPCVSVYGARERSLTERFEQRYDIKHNVLGINSNRDGKEKRLAETRNVLSVIECYRKEIDFGFDLHTTTEPGWGDYMTVYPDALPNRDVVVETNDYLRIKNFKGREPYVKYVGPASTYPMNDELGSMDLAYDCTIFREYGIPVCTLEHSDFRFDERLGSSITMTRAVEMFVNQIIQSAKFFRDVI